MNSERIIVLAAATLIFSTSAQAADEKISAMPGGSALTGTEKVPMVQSGSNIAPTSQATANLWIHGAPVRWTVSQISGTPFTNGTIIITGAADCAGHLLTMPFSNGQGAGSGTLDVKIGTNDVTGLATVAVTNPGTGTATAANSFSLGGTLSAAWSNVSGTLDGYFTLVGTCD